MFEAAISPAVIGTGVSDAARALRPLEWSELVARFAAARDLRGLLARPMAASGSFADHAARGLAWNEDGERAVNHDALGRGKTPAAISFATAEEATVGDQGTR